MKLERSRPITGFHCAFAGALLLILVVCLATAGAAVRPAVAQASVARGVADPFFVYMSTTNEQQPGIDEIANDLGAGYIRFFISWASAEPTGPSITNTAYMSQVASAVQIAHNDGLKAIITFNEVPEWASDRALWKYTGSHGNTKYFTREAMSAAHLPDFQNFCKTVAAQFQGEVWGYEVWNEPNLSLFLSPQLYPGHPHFSSDLYVQMLKACRTGILAGDPGSVTQPRPFIIAGGTDPRGSNDAGSTTPQTFALRLAAAHVTSLFDYYSHHPYMPGAEPRLWPEAAPRDTRTTVTLENLGTLLKIFPTKPFLLTEYGVQTADNGTFSHQFVNQATQADYLRRAYAYVKRYKQVKLLMWYLLKDYKPAPPQPAVNGFYTGLDTATGAHKRAWYVFAGGTSLTLNAPAKVKRGAAAKLTGTLARQGLGLSARPVLQSHRAGRPWVTAKTFSTSASGGYALWLRPQASTYYRVAWLGVVTSRQRLVTVH
jgi:Cellulase (glycosyl hydrolase family 5)